MGAGHSRQEVIGLWITLHQAVQFVIECFNRMHGGEVFVPKIPSMRIKDLARAVAPDARLNIIGIRPGEKLHEELISIHDARRTLDLGSCYVIQPDMEWWSAAKNYGGKPVPLDFSFTSDQNSQWLDAAALQEILEDV